MVPAGAQAATPAPPQAEAVHAIAAASGYLGVTFGFSDRTLRGGPYENQGSQIFNLPMFKSSSDEAKFWDNYVEELLASGVDFVAPTIRGYVNAAGAPNGGGDTRKLSGLVAAIQRRGATDKIKISALDDTPASMTDKKNWVKHRTGGYYPPFDIGDATGAGEGGYQYVWDNNLRAFFQTVPDELRFKVDGRPVLYEWSVNDFAFTNQKNGNTRKLAEYIRSRAKAEFGVDPYLIVDQSWVQQDPTVATAVDGVHSWFGVPGTGSTVTTFNGRGYGVVVPGFRFVNSTTSMVIDPNHGQTLSNNLKATVGAGAVATLVEGFTDWEENAATWRAAEGSYAARHYDYPNQMINILRQGGRNPFPADLRVEAESADAYSDATSGNRWGLYRDGNVDVELTGDSGGGWDVGDINAGEWLEWREVPLSGAVTLKARVATPNSGVALRFVVDGVNGPTISVPNTGGWQTYQTVGAGTFNLAPDSHHTVRIEFVSGQLNLNYWTN